MEKILDSHFEVINADSMQVYRYFNIGTAKPDTRLREKIRHHLVDFVDPKVQYNVGEFVKSADAKVFDIWNRGNIPVVVGGTGFYLKNFVLGLPQTPPGDRVVRKSLEERFANEGLDSLYRELCEVDEVSAKKIGKRDKYRIIRALEVFYSGGRPLSEYRVPSEMRNVFEFLLIGLIRPREELYERIERRVEEMFAMGLLKEVKALLSSGFSFGDPAFKGIGYREFAEFSKGCLSLEGVKDNIKRNSKRYAKRQITYMKQLKGMSWYNPKEYLQIRRLIEKFIGDIVDPLT